MKTPTTEQVSDMVINNGGNTPYNSMVLGDTLTPITYNIFTDSSKTTISNDVLTTVPLISSGKFFYYPNGDTDNNETPTWVDIRDASKNITNAYKSALASVYKDAPSSITMYSQYDKRATNFGSSAPQSTLKYVNGYLKQRGFPNISSTYDPKMQNLYVNGSISSTGFLIGIDFGYSGASVIPNKIHLCLSSYRIINNDNTYGRYNISSKEVIDTQSNASAYFANYLTLDVTTTISEYLQKKANGLSTVFYDVPNNYIHIYSPGKAITDYSGNSVTFGQSWNEHVECGNFNGSFAIVRQDQTTGLYSSSNPRQANVALFQISQILSYEFVFESRDTSGVMLPGFPISRTLSYNVNVGGLYKGIVLTKVGFGVNGAVVSTFKSGIEDAYSIDSVIPLNITGTSSGNSGISRNIGDNPFTTTRERFAGPSFVIMLDNAFLAQLFKCLNVNKDLVLKSTPESFNALGLTESNFVESKNNSYLEIIGHEMSHTACDNGVYSMAKSNPCNTESLATAKELDYQYSIGLIDSSGIITNEYPVYNAFREYQLTSFMYDFLRGTNQLASTGIYANNKKAPASLFLHNYGEGIYQLYIKEHYDSMFQMMRRSLDITLKTVQQYLYDNGLVTGGKNSSVASKLSWLLAEKQAFTELASALSISKTYSQMFADFCVSMVLLRNNILIPEQFRTQFPYWMYDKRQAYAEYTNSYSKYFDYYPTNTGNLWYSIDTNAVPNWDVDLFTISDFGGYTFANESFVPMWPRDASGTINFTSGSFVDDVWTPSTLPYATLIDSSSGLRSNVYEDFTCLSYILPTGAYAGMTTKLSSVTVNVYRGDWAIKVVQFAANGTDAGGTWREYPSAGAFTQLNKEGVYNPVTDDFTDASGSPLSVTIDLSSFVPVVYGGVTYLPKLVCVNNGLHGDETYGMPKTVYGTRCRYSGKLTLSATVVSA